MSPKLMDFKVDGRVLLLYVKQTILNFKVHTVYLAHDMNYENFIFWVTK